jgi:alpha-tubulin suppressor-like RCC1 family protein
LLQVSSQESQHRNNTTSLVQFQYRHRNTLARVVRAAPPGDGTAYCWGYNYRGNLGRGYWSLTEYTPEPVIGGHVFQSVNTGCHSCGLTGEGDAWCWGYNPYGQLGLGYTSLRELTPQAVIGGHTFAYVSAGVLHTCGATTAGEAWCWGDNQRGEVGDGSYTDRAQPVFVFDLSPPTP